MTKPSRESKAGAKHLLGEPTLEGLADYIKLHNIRKILCLVGAGASVGAGIPDFRSPKTGIYSKLEKYNLSDPIDAFSLALLRKDPSIFYSIATEMNLWPGFHKPTAVHHFIKLLADEGRLLRCCTQNIDGLEGAAGLPGELLVEAHGSFQTSSCIDCHRQCSTLQLRREIEGGTIYRCVSCGGIVKPDVVFFGEQLPERFFDVLRQDTKEADLVIIIGTSLQVQPFALLPLYVQSSIPRVIFNLERVGGRMFYIPEDDVSDETTSVYDKSATASSAAGTSIEDYGTAVGAITTEGNEAATPNGNHNLSSDALGGSSAGELDSVPSSSEGFAAEYEEGLCRPEVCRDLLIKGDCQASIIYFAECLGLGERLRSVLLEHEAR